MRWREAVGCGVAAWCLTLATGAAAADAPAAGSGDHAETDDRDGSLQAALTLDARAGVWDARNVVGLSSGPRAGVGFRLRGATQGHAGRHAFRSALTFEEGLGGSLELGTVVKTEDAASLEGAYLYEVASWFGPLVRVGVTTSLFASRDERGVPTRYRLLMLDGTAPTTESNGLDLTDPLRPLRLTQSVGPLLRPVASRPASVFLHAGAAARETLAEGQVAAADRSATTAVEVVELPSLAAAGANGGLSLHGRIEDVGIVYAARAEMMVPFAHTEPAVDLGPGLLVAMTIEVATEIGVQLGGGTSLNYGFRAMRDPLVLDAFQYQTGLDFAFTSAVVTGDDDARHALP